MGDDEEMNAVRTELQSLKEFMTVQFDYLTKQMEHGRDHFEKLETSTDKMAARISVLEGAKLYFDGAKYGFGLAIVMGTTAVIGAAIWIITKLTPAGN